MFQDLDATLRKLLTDPADASVPPELRAADVSFETPDKNFQPKQATVNLFLHEVSENRNLRDPAPPVSTAGGLYTMTPPPLRVDCVYLVTTWSSLPGEDRVVEEHRLLGQVLQRLSRFATVPDVYLQNGLAAQPLPPPTLVAQVDVSRTPSDFWHALEIAPRPAFQVLVTIAMVTADAETGPVVD